ncbi:MAG TPA: TIGR03943 family protein [Firmicutes bacterium]|nr:TIGR03943 family protein [Bacillota bacterium]
MRRINVGTLLWTLFLAFSAIGISCLLRSGKLAFYLHPRTWGSLRLATILLMLLCIASWRGLRSSNGHLRLSWAHALFFLPLLLALCCPPQMLSLEVIGNKGLMGVLRGHATSSIGSHTPAPVFAPDQPIIINSENFISMMDALWEDTDTYLGREIEMLGFIYEDQQLAPDDFVLARLIMNCCAADAQVAGLLCRYRQRSQLQPGEWVTVRGTLAKMPYYNVAVREVIDMPYIEVTVIMPAEKPDNEYIYP